MTKTKLAELTKRLKLAMTDLAKVRDELRDVQSEAEDLADCADDAHESLELTIERLSELV